MEELSEYFNVSIQYLNGKEDVAPTLLSDEEKAAIEQYRTMSKEKNNSVSPQEIGEVILGYMSAPENIKAAIKSLLNI